MTEAYDRDRNTWVPAEARGEAPVRPRLSGRRILVVGAGSQPCDDPDPPVGNGRAISVLAAREGARVACADVSERAARDTLELVEKAGGAGCVLTADVRDEAACRRLVDQASEELGGLDGLVLNVGIGAGGGVEGTETEAWDRVMAINLRSHFLVSRFAFPHLGPGAAIVFISSIAGRRGGSPFPAYDASKGGVEALCRSVAASGGNKCVRANVVVPGAVDTPLGRWGTREKVRGTDTTIALGREGTGWEMAYATCFLLSDEASYITGQTLVVDGGLTSVMGGRR